jgi:hypothetical protein
MFCDLETKVDVRASLVLNRVLSISGYSMVLILKAVFRTKNRT